MNLSLFLWHLFLFIMIGATPIPETLEMRNSVIPSFPSASECNQFFDIYSLFKNNSKYEILFYDLKRNISAYEPLFQLAVANFSSNAISIYLSGLKNMYPLISSPIHAQCFIVLANEDVRLPLIEYCEFILDPNILTIGNNKYSSLIKMIANHTVGNSVFNTLKTQDVLSIFQLAFSKDVTIRKTALDNIAISYDLIKSIYHAQQFQILYFNLFCHRLLLILLRARVPFSQ